MPNRPQKKKRPWKPPVDKTPFGRRKADNQDFYNSPRWRKVARAHKEKNPFCVKCEKEGIISAVEFTDHIVRIEDGGEKYTESNLQSLCSFHHNQKSGREAHGYKEKKQ
jgi:5-methylcytosine-specific restriction endonuclease McrA